MNFCDCMHDAIKLLNYIKLNCNVHVLCYIEMKMHIVTKLLFFFFKTSLADMIKRMINTCTLLIYEINFEYPFIYRKSQTFAHKSKTIF